MSFEQCRACGAVVDDGEDWREGDPVPDNYIACHMSGVGATCRKCYEPSQGKPPPYWPKPLPQAELDRLAKLNWPKECT